MTKEGEWERVANSLGLPALWYSSCAFPPLHSQSFSQNLKETKMKLNNRVHFQIWVVVQRSGLGFSVLRIYTILEQGVDLLCHGLHQYFCLDHMWYSPSILSYWFSTLRFTKQFHTHLICPVVGRLCVCPRGSVLLVGCFFIPFHSKNPGYKWYAGQLDQSPANHPSVGTYGYYQCKASL